MSQHRSTVLIAQLVALWVLAMPLGYAADWDVTDTGQPYTDATFTLEEGTWMSLDLHPDGSSLVFDLLGDIYMIPSSGGDATLIHGGPAMVRMPRFSPDGNQLLYISDQSGGDNLWVSNLDGSGARQVNDETADVLTNPVWDPQGDYVAATRLSSDYDQLFTSELRIYHLDGGLGQPMVASPTPYQNVTEAQFSPDGRYLFYTHKVGGPEGKGVFIDANHTVHAIMERDLETGSTRELLKGFGGATTAQPSPSGRQIAFVRRVKDKTVLFVYDRETGEQRPVYDELDRDMQGEWIAQGTYYPQYDWFPDGRHIAIWGKGKLFKVDTLAATAQEIPFRVKVQHRITEVARFAADPAPEQFTVKAIRHLAVAPNKRAVSFNALGHIWQKGLPNGEPKRISTTQAFEFEPAYSPDGSSLAYVEWDDEKGSALKVRSAAGKLRTLVRNRGVLRQPAFSPDGKTLVYQVQADSKCMGGYGNAAGIYRVPVSGKGGPVLISEQGQSPLFSPDGNRIYYTVRSDGEHGAVTQLASVNLSGFEQRVHAVMAGADRTELKISPDLQWVGFKERQQYYVMPLTATASPMPVSADGGATPVVQLTESGGHNLSWSADSNSLYWLLGDRLEGFALVRSVRIETAVIGLRAKSDVPAGTVAFTGARLITMADEVIENGTLVVTGNRITAVGPQQDVTIPKGAIILESSGKTIMPGLVNMHGHLDSCYYESTGGIPQKQASHYASLAFGITTNFDPYASELPSYSMSEMRNAGVMVGPRTISVGSVIYGRPGKSDSVYTPINSLADAKQVMQRKKALGGGTIKSYRQPLRRQRQQLVRAAREAGIMVSIEGESHLYNNLSAVLDGHNTVEHNLPVANYYDDVVQLFAHSKTANTPTLVATFGEIMGENYIYQKSRTWEDPRIDSFVPEVTSGYSPLGIPYAAPLYARGMTSLHAADELWEIGFKAVARSTKKLDDTGVLVNVGSHSQVQGLAMHWEMQLMTEGGMSNKRVLRAATLNGATTLGMEREIGSLEVGKLADLIVLEKNPLENILNTKTVVQTMIGGRLYDSYSMDEIGNYKRPRTKFYWELGDHKGTGWNEAAAGQ